ncbi:MAG: putative lipid II flippase FtsW [Myxococcota bacterium]
MSSTMLPSVPAPDDGGALSALRRLDWWLVVSVVLLLGFGALMILSASSLYADAKFGDALRFVTRQSFGMIAGVGMLAGILLLPWSWLRRGAVPAYVIGIVGLVLVFTPLGHSAYAATRWISLGPVNVQPSEFAKIALVLVMASYLSANEGRLGDVLGVGVPALLIPVPMIVLLMLEPDFGTTVITVALCGVMLFVAGLHWGWLASLSVLAAGGLSIMAAAKTYRVRRMLSFMDPFQDASGDGHQVVQGWIAMASGGWFGQGIASGVAQRGNLPEAHTDFISAVVGEELGAVGWIVLIGLYLVLVWRGFGIAARSRSLFGTLVAAAITTLLASQAIINLGVVVGWMPAKGLVLPFMSYGASAVLAHLICIGLLLRVSMQTELEADGADPPGPSPEYGGVHQ